MIFDIMHTESSLRKPDNIAIGGLFYLGSSFALAVMAALVKLVPNEVHIGTIIFFQYGIAFLLCIPGVLKEGGLPNLKTTKFKAHLFRDIAGILTFSLYFFALDSISLVNASVLRSTTPFWLPLILFVWRRDKISMALWISIIIGFFGVILVIKPTTHGYFNVGSLFALASGFFMAISALTIRRLGATEPPQRTLFYYCLLATLVSAPFAFNHWVHLNSHAILLLIAIGIIMYLIQYTLILAFRHAKASKIAPISYSTIVCAGLLEWLIWGKLPDLMGYIGIFLIIVAGLTAIFFERKNEKIEKQRGSL